MVITPAELTIKTSLNRGQSHQTNLNIGSSSRSQKDITKPDGEACNEDGTLKDASEMEWLNSPGSNSSPIPFSKRAHNDSDEDEVTSKKKTCVSIKSKAEKRMRLTFRKFLQNVDNRKKTQSGEQGGQVQSSPEMEDTAMMDWAQASALNSI